MTGREKVLEVERQVRAILASSDGYAFSCPFCNLQTHPGCDVLCCNEAADVICAVMDYIETAAQLDLCDMVMNRLAKMQSRSALVN